VTAPDLRVVTLHESTLRDIPNKLRELADAIEQGNWGEVSACGVVTFGSKLEVFGFGDGVHHESVGASFVALFHAGAARIVNDIERHGRE
jgi:hypothetical protein